LDIYKSDVVEQITTKIENIKRYLENANVKLYLEKEYPDKTYDEIKKNILENVFGYIVGDGVKPINDLLLSFENIVLSYKNNEYDQLIARNIASIQNNNINEPSAENNILRQKINQIDIRLQEILT
jgi:hypothetical protein